MYLIFLSKLLYEINLMVEQKTVLKMFGVPMVLRGPKNNVTPSLPCPTYEPLEHIRSAFFVLGLFERLGQKFK